MWIITKLFEKLNRIEGKIDEALRKEGEIMSGLTDLQDVVVKLQSDLTTLQATVQSAITAIENAGDPDAAVATAAQALQAVDTALEAANTSLAAALPAPPTPSS